MQTFAEPGVQVCDFPPWPQVFEPEPVHVFPAPPAVVVQVLAFAPDTQLFAELPAPPLQEFAVPVVAVPSQEFAGVLTPLPEHVFDPAALQLLDGFPVPAQVFPVVRPLELHLLAVPIELPVQVLAGAPVHELVVGGLQTAAALAIGGFVRKWDTKT